MLIKEFIAEWGLILPIGVAVTALGVAAIIYFFQKIPKHPAVSEVKTPPAPVPSAVVQPTLTPRPVSVISHYENNERSFGAWTGFKFGFGFAAGVFVFGLLLSLVFAWLFSALFAAFLGSLTLFPR